MDRAASAIRFLQLEPPALARRPLLALRVSAPHTPASKRLFILQCLRKCFPKCNPLDDLREHLDELDRGKPVYVNCQTGLRSYLACRLLTQYGFTCAHLSGGYSFYQVVTKEQQTARSAYPCGMEKL